MRISTGKTLPHSGTILSCFATVAFRMLFSWLSDILTNCRVSHIRNFKSAVRTALQYTPVSTHDSGDGPEGYTSPMVGYAPPNGAHSSSRETELARFNRMAGGSNTYPLPNPPSSQSRGGGVGSIGRSSLY